jgi:hypothetical protein
MVNDLVCVCGSSNLNKIDCQGFFITKKNRLFYLDSSFVFLYQKALLIEGSSNGRTTGSGPVNPGSNPGPSAK